jgi:hypothetical protein
VVDTVNPTSPANPPADLPVKAAAVAQASGAGQAIPPAGAVAALTVTPGMVSAVAPPTSFAKTTASETRTADSPVAPGVAPLMDAITPQPLVVVDRVRTGSGETDRKAGAGVYGPTSGQVPPAGTIAATSSTASPDGVGSSFALTSIAGFMPGGKFSDPEVVCAMALDATGKVQSQGLLSQIDDLNRERAQAADGQQAEAKKALDELAQSHDDGWGKFFKDLVLVVGIALAASGYGSAAGVAVLAAVEANEQMEERTGHGIGGTVAKKLGGEKYADTADMAVTAALLIASVVVGGGGSTSALRKAELAVQAGGKVGVAVTDRQTAGHKAAAEEASAGAKVAEAQVHNVDERFNQVLEHLKKNMAAQQQMIADAQETSRDRSRITARHVA